MKKLTHSIILLFSLFTLNACQASVGLPEKTKPQLVVTYSIMGSIVKELVGDKAEVVVMIPNGQDPHEWEPSAKEIETITHADLIIQNGLGLEGGMEKSINQAKESGVEIFTASDFIDIRHVKEGEGIPTGDEDQALGAEDPHLWTDPVEMKKIVIGLSEKLDKMGLDVKGNEVVLTGKLDSIDHEIRNLVDRLPEGNRKFVTGHESMGYFAERYGFKLIGAIIPSLTTQAQVSASDMAALSKLIKENDVKAVFTELGTPSAVSDTIGKETGIKVIELSTHQIPDDGSYFTFLRNLAETVISGLK